MRLKSPVHRVRLFTHDRIAKTLVAEISDLGNQQPWGRFYDDADSVGFTLLNGFSEATFFLSEVQRDAEGDTQAWIFLPTLRALHKHPKLSGYQVIVFND